MDKTPDIKDTNDKKDIKDASLKKVQSHYSQVAKQVLENFSDADIVGAQSCCESPCNASEARFLYAQDVLQNVPGAARAASRGCADPVARAGLQTGERVLDLGCGGGIDALIASRIVGDEGKVFGIDMTPEMVKLACDNARVANCCNVEFLEGNIESLPMPDATLDVVISNCVINFSENKQKVMSEACRVLAPGGRFVVSDIVSHAPIKKASYEPLCKIVGTTNGMEDVAEYKKMLKRAGFDYVSIEPKTTYTMDILQKKAKQKGRLEYFDAIRNDESVSGASGSVIIIAEKMGDVSAVPDEPIGAGMAPKPSDVQAICDVALSGHTPKPEHLAELLEIKPETESADILNKIAEELVRRANKGLGYIYAQIGLDCGPCPGNCHFCNFAACNYKENKTRTMSMKRLEHLCELFSENGVHLISLMSSAARAHKDYLEAIKIARKAAEPHVLIMANTADLTYTQAKEIKMAGADCIYHAVRLGEGTITDIPQSVRWNTIDSAKRAGLLISSAIEPLYQCNAHSKYVQTKREIVDMMLRILRYDLFCTGCVNLNAVSGTKMQNVKPWSTEKMRIIANTLHIASHGRVKHGGCCSIQWVDVGDDPRDRGYKNNDEALISQIERARELLGAGGWTLAAQRSSDD